MYFYFFQGKNLNIDKETGKEPDEIENVIQDYTVVNVAFPSGTDVQLSSIKVARTFDTLSILEAALNEFINFKGIVSENYLPEKTSLLGVYFGIDKILYLDLSGEFRKNFKGDALDEFIILKALYKTITSNVDVEDVKILLDSKETESFGGHFYIKYPIRRLVSQEVEREEKP
ncbi:spore germination protein [Candidatus Magnetoovum chiemensis]|nr:spore germination protein [Candidatus Magnetoovum chiemensis]